MSRKIFKGQNKLLRRPGSKSRRTCISSVTEDKIPNFKKVRPISCRPRSRSSGVEPTLSWTALFFSLLCVSCLFCRYWGCSPAYAQYNSKFHVIKSLEENWMGSPFGISHCRPLVSTGWFSSSLAWVYSDRYCNSVWQRVWRNHWYFF